MSEPERPKTPDETGDRVQSVLDAAERAASEILADATQEAQRRVTEARERAERLGRERVEMMSALSDSLLEQATTVKRQADVLIEALDRVIAALELELESGVRPEPAKSPPAAPSAPAPAAEPPRPSPPPAFAPGPAAPPPAPASQTAPAPPPPGAPPRADSVARQRALEAIRERIAHSAEQARRPAPASAPASNPPAALPPAAQPPVASPPPVAPAAPAPAPRASAPPPASPRPAGSQPKRRQAPSRPPRKPVSESAAEAARLLATQMAVAGSTRAEILNRLRKEFGIDDPEPIVDAVVGGH